MKKHKWMLCLLALLLTGCSLAQPEAEAEEGSEDRWIGFYVVPSQDGEHIFNNNPYLEEYGTLSAETDQFGTLNFPQVVLFAAEDAEGNFTFPGIAHGYSLFLIQSVQDGAPYVKAVSNMSPGTEDTQFTYTNEGSSSTISGTIYYGAPLGTADWDAYTSHVIWNYYQVYQTEDGRIYLNGHANSTNGPMNHTATRSYTTTTNGVSVTDSLRATVSIETAHRLEKLVVTQFSAANQAIHSDDLALREDLPEVRCAAEAAWVLVEEISGEKTVRTIYNVPGPEEDPLSHLVVLLDEEGFGQPADLHITAGEKPIL